MIQRIDVEAFDQSAENVFRNSRQILAASDLEPQSIRALPCEYNVTDIDREPLDVSSNKRTRTS